MIFKIYHRSVTRVTWRVPRVEQELLSLQEHSSSLPVFSGGRVSQFLVFCVVFCKWLFVPFFLLAIVLTVRFTAPDYPFCIFQIVLMKWIIKMENVYFPETYILFCYTYLFINDAIILTYLLPGRLATKHCKSVKATNKERTGTPLLSTPWQPTISRYRNVTYI